MNELVFDCYEAAIYAAMILLQYGHYVVMLSREEQLWIVNYLYSGLCSRNDVVFMRREDFEENYVLSRNMKQKYVEVEEA